jgi:hypothetical protein
MIEVVGLAIRLQGLPRPSGASGIHEIFGQAAAALRRGRGPAVLALLVSARSTMRGLEG